MIILIMSLASACSEGDDKATNLDQKQNPSENEVKKEPEAAKQVEEVVIPEEIEMTLISFEEMLKELPLTVVSTEYVVQDTEYKSLYPDMLQAVIENHTNVDVKDAIVAFAAWDQNNLPVKLKGNIDFSEGTYVSEINYNDINLVAGGTYGEESGYALDPECKVSSFVALPISFVTFEGETWENPYYDDWKKLYEGVKYHDELTVEIVLKEAIFESKEGSKNKSVVESISESELLSQLDAQELGIIETKYVVQDTEYKSLYPDLLQAIIRNDTKVDIKNAVVAFVAWDENKLPVKVKGSFDFSDGSYVQLVNYNDINLIPGASYGNDSGFEIDETNRIQHFKAIIVSYESFEGTNWENPLFMEWKKLYEGKKLN